MTLIRYCWESTCEQGNDFINRHVMARFTQRFISCHVMAGSTWRFISCHVITIYVGGREVKCPTVYEGYMVRYIVGFRVSYNHFNNYGYCVYMIICTT